LTNTNSTETKHPIDSVSAIQTPPLRALKKANKKRTRKSKANRKRDPVKGGRPEIVSIRLTVEQLDKLERLVAAYVKNGKIDYNRSAVLAELLDKAK
jgi:hypothetical protein